MKAFCRLFEQLDGSGGSIARVDALAGYFAAVPPADAAWALHALLGKQRKRLITGRRLREICLERTGMPAWLFDQCHAQVGDSAETIALLWRPAHPPESAAADRQGGETRPLHVWMEEVLPRLASLEGPAQAEAVGELWNGLEPLELLVGNKLLTGGFRVGVAQGLVLRALAKVSGLEESLLAHRLMGGFAPSAAAYRSLMAEGRGEEPALSRPYPFFLASPLDPAALAESAPGDWLLEWKWDGIRGQLIQRGGESFLWSRGEELLNPVFPDLVTLADGLPDGTVLDGEVIVWPQDAPVPSPFAALQRRLGRKAPGAAILRECPAAFVAYDLLESEGEDRRSWPLAQRRQWLEDLRNRSAPARLRLSPCLALTSWQQLDVLREQAREAGAEGLMLKRLNSPYLVGRRRGHWWKHKLAPMELDAVLLYAQAGSGRRANLFTDYSFGLWDGEGRLVTFAKAYSGLDNAEIDELDRWIRRHTTERFGPVRAVEPLQVFTLAFEGLQRSKRHRSGLAVRFPRILRWRRDRTPESADSLASALALLGEPGAAQR
ncbi:ATP-dependent DNA ligase [Synechococcus sp. CCY 9618]|uniref:ATP-dependent DNA ligase n=1 Tax=Synechococcus sp. CCY 9618 TaxID=2815602 RepID=UPI001C2103F9|nr:ATP-dependent DNA ligase [Synechococcus sp. CCY 9618]